MASRSIRLLVWAEYLAPAVLARFETETGIHVDEVTFGGEDQAVARMTAGEAFDVVVASDYILERYRVAGLLQPLDMDRLPAFGGVTDARLRRPPHDPETDGHKYSSCCTSARRGSRCASTRSRTRAQRWKMLFDREYAGQIAMLGGAREVLRASPLPARQRLQLHRSRSGRRGDRDADRPASSGRLYDSSDVRSHLLDGTAIVHCWNGDAASALSHGVFQIAYLPPDEGFSAWMDAPFIPARAADPEAAHQLLDFLLRPEVAARNADFSGYMPALPAADALVKSAVQRSLQPLESQAARGVFQRDLGAFNGVYEEAFLRVLAS